MEWETRPLEVLLATEPNHHRMGAGKVVMVNTEEARMLADVEGCRMSSGSENLERNTQRYTINGKTYFWLAGYGSPEWDDPFPVASGCPRLESVLADARTIGL